MLYKTYPLKDPNISNRNNVVYTFLQHIFPGNLSCEHVTPVAHDTGGDREWCGALSGSFISFTAVAAFAAFASCNLGNSSTYPKIDGFEIYKMMYIILI